MSKKGISQIKGPSEIRLGETAYYEVSRIYDLDDREKVSQARWKLYALDFDQHDNWRELKPGAGAPPKIGHRIPLTVTKQSLVGSELMLEAFIYEAEKRIPPGLRIKVLPGLEKKITRVELFKVDDSPIKEDTVMKYGQTIKVKVYTHNMQDEMVKLSLYEDDADGGGHSLKNKNNLVAQITKALNKKGFLWHEFKLNADFSKIANAMMDGTHDKLHEYYVVVETAEHRSVSKNVDVQNPDYIKVQTVSSGKPFDTEEIYDGGEIEEVVVKGKLKRQYGANPAGDTGDKVVTVFKPDEKKKDDKCLCKQYDLIWGDKVSCEFRKKVVEICADLWGEKRKIEMANGLMAVMNVETRGSFKAQQLEGWKSVKDPKQMTIQDFWKEGNRKSSRAIGLIQFTQDALENNLKEYVSNSKLSIEEKFDELNKLKLRYAQMGEVDQLEKVKKYFEPQKNSIKSPEDIYLAVFAPKGVSKNEDYVLYRNHNNPKTRADIEDSKNYKANESVDIENKGKLYGADGKIQRIEILGRYKISYIQGLTAKENIFDCNGIIKNNEKSDKDIITYRIFYEGSIEKYIPKLIKEEYKNSYKYLYFDKNNKEHLLGIFKYIKTKQILPGNVVGNGSIEILDIRQFKGYNKDNVKMKFLTINTESGRYYINPDCFAGLLGAMGDLNIDYLGFNGFSNVEGKSTGGSKSHRNGEKGDLRYLSKNKKGETTYLQDLHFDVLTQNKFNDALYNFGWGRQEKMYSEYFTYNNEKNYLLNHTKHMRKDGVGGYRHYHHLHLSGFDHTLIKIINEK